LVPSGHLDRCHPTTKGPFGDESIHLVCCLSYF